MVSFIFWIFVSWIWSSPQAHIKGIIADANTKEPIGDVHIFEANSATGTFSNLDGRFQLEQSALRATEIVFTHIGYETRIVRLMNTHSVLDLDTVFLEPAAIDLSAITIKAQRSRDWKRRFKTFKSEFLGRSEFGEKCEILNPESLIFEITDGGELMASATDVLKILNPKFGYLINYVLEEFTTDARGNTHYGGKAYFELLPQKNKKDSIKCHQNRLAAFQRSMSFFFHSLIEDKLDENGFQMGIASLNNSAEFQLMGAASRESILSYNKDHGVFVLKFTEFLRVQNSNLRVERQGIANTRSLAILGRPAEKDLIQQSRSEFNHQNSEAISYLYKIVPEIYIDQSGTVLNSESFREYGYWANLRVGDMLPFEFKPQ